MAGIKAGMSSYNGIAFVSSACVKNAHNVSRYIIVYTMATCINSFVIKQDKNTVNEFYIKEITNTVIAVALITIVLTNNCTRSPYQNTKVTFKLQ